MRVFGSPITLGLPPGHVRYHEADNCTGDDHAYRAEFKAHESNARDESDGDGDPIPFGERLQNMKHVLGKKYRKTGDDADHSSRNRGEWRGQTDVVARCFDDGAASQNKNERGRGGVEGKAKPSIMWSGVSHWKVDTAP